MPKSVVSIVKGTDAEKMVEESLSLLGGVNSLIKPNSVVVIKPNIGHPFPPETSVCTSPAVVAATIKVIRKAGPKEIIVAEAAARGCDTLEALEVSGIARAAQEAGADRIIDIKRDKDLIDIPIRDAKSDLTRVLLPRFLLEADHLVNLPIFKTHVAMVFTCALKNVKGVVQDKIHAEMHQTDLAAAMMDLWSVCKADLSIVDMIRPAEGFGPHSTLPMDFGCIVAGKDPVAIDATCCRMVGLDINRVTYFKAARERGLGYFRESQMEIRGKTIKEVFQQMWLPYLNGFDQWPEYNFYLDNACSSCLGLAAVTMEKLKARGEYEKNAGMSIAIGRKRELPKGVAHNDMILFGNCVKKWRDQGIFIQGCPPTESVPYTSIVERLDSDEVKKMVEASHTTEYYRTKEASEEEQRLFLPHIKKLREKAMAEAGENK